MKSFLKLYLFILSGILFIATGCDNILDEEPRSVIVPQYFDTPEGLQGAVTACYSNMRRFYGTEGFMCTVVSGTDEFTYAAGSGSDMTAFNNYSETALTPSNSQLATTWQQPYANINTLNGVVNRGPGVAMNDTNIRRSLIAEAKYLRAHNYYILLMEYGSVTLTLDFAEAPTTEAYRNPTSDIFAAIIKDLKEAIEVLPNTPREQGRIAKPGAMHLLSKVYLARAGSADAQPGDYEQAANWATTVIKNKAMYQKELLSDYASIHQRGNENNTESLYVIQRNENTAYNEETLSGGNKENRANFFFTPYYENVKSKGLSTMVRDAANGRPWRRYMPTRWLLDTAFNDKVNDTRFHKSFQTVWICNQSNAAQRLPGMRQSIDTAIWMPGYNMDTAIIRTKNYLVITPDANGLKTWADGTRYDYNQGYTPGNRDIYPCLRKHLDPGLVNVTGGGNGGRRPFIVHRLGETYLLAAEALVRLGKLDSAAYYVNIIKQRAANNGGNYAAISVTASDMTIDYILDEKSREMCGEASRWFDLKASGKLYDRATKHNSDARAGIRMPKHLVRPIPQAQLDQCSNDYGQNADY